MLGGSNTPSAAGFENLYSLDFDGVNDYVTIPDHASYTPTSLTGWTISCWVKLSIVNKIFVSKRTTPNIEWNLGAAKTTGYASMIFYGGNSLGNVLKLAAHINISDGNWHHVMFTFDGLANSTSIIGYIDGTKYSVALGNATFVTVGSWTGVTNTVAPLEFGADRLTWFTACGIDEVSIFDSVLDATTAVDMYNSGTPTDLTGATDLQGWWRNGDIAGTSVYPTIEDYSSVGNDGTMTNMASGDIVTDVP